MDALELPLNEFIHLSKYIYCWVYCSRCLCNEAPPEGFNGSTGSRSPSSVRHLAKGALPPKEILDRLKPDFSARFSRT